jgi:hypothetical protein
MLAVLDELVRTVHPASYLGVNGVRIQLTEIRGTRID